ncbi:MAG: hypothetical protein V4492_02965 [Chlamydiota bacterium]
MKIAIYLAGSIKKGHEKSGDTYWTEADIQCIEQNLSECTISFLNPAFRKDDLTDPLSVFGRDMLQVFSSNFVLVDARDRRGLGVGAEMMWAKLNGIPVISWAPMNSHYHKRSTTLLDVPVENFIHPFVEALSDKIAEDLVEAALWIRKVLADPSLSFKGIDHIGVAMEHYKKTQLHLDDPMKQMLEASKALQQRAQRSLPQVTVSSCH